MMGSESSSAIFFGTETYKVQFWDFRVTSDELLLSMWEDVEDAEIVLVYVLVTLA